MGRDPIAQPPGNATLALPNRAKSGPKTTIEALILETYLNGAICVNGLVASTSIIFSSSSNPIVTFKYLITLFIVYTSDKTGTFNNLVLPSIGRIVAANSGNTAFLAPSISTSP